MGRRSYQLGGSRRVDDTAGREALLGAPLGRMDVARAYRGDVAAFSKLVEAHSGLVRGVAVRLLGGEDAEDACQEVWIRVWLKIAGFRGDSAFTTWLYRVATNTCRGLRRARLRRPEGASGREISPHPADVTGGASDPEASVLGAERREEMASTLARALGRVRAEHREALILRHAEGLSYAEIADLLDVPNGTAKGWVSRGRAALLLVLTEENGAW